MIHLVRKIVENKLFLIKWYFMKSNKGFSLIELIAVIIILSIISSVIYSKWLSFQQSAHVTQIHDLKASLMTAENQVYALAAIQNKTMGEGKVNMDGRSVDVMLGYPLLNIKNLLNIIDIGQSKDKSVEDCKEAIACKIGDWYITDYSLAYPNRQFPPTVIFSLNEPMFNNCSLIYQYKKFSGLEPDLTPDITIDITGC